MKIFILEDDPARMISFRKKLVGIDIVHADNVSDAKVLLKANTDLSVLFLDHDLGGKQFVSTSDKNTGSELARWIHEENLFFDQIVIHSLNPVGALYMRLTLSSSAREVRTVPFCLLIMKI